jgi:hypothetical protein
MPEQLEHLDVALSNGLLAVRGALVDVLRPQVLRLDAVHVTDRVD